jgi:hypothetical protein
MSDPLPAPSFPGGYTVPPMDIGSGYAAGISQAGKSIAAAIGSVADIAKQNADTNDTITAMHQTGILSPEQYQAVMGKSLGAKQTMVGLYAGQWLADEAAKRAVGQVGGSEHAKLAQQIAAIRAGYGQIVGIPPGKQIIPAQQPNQQVPTAPAVNRAQPVDTAAQAATQNQQWIGAPGQPSPLATSGNIYNPIAAAQPNAPGTRYMIGAPMAPTEKVTPGSRMVTMAGGKRGILQPDGITIRPMP